MILMATTVSTYSLTKSRLRHRQNIFFIVHDDSGENNPSLVRAPTGNLLITGWYWYVDARKQVKVTKSKSEATLFKLLPIETELEDMGPQLQNEKPKTEDSVL